MQQAANLAPQVASSLGQMDGLPGQLVKRTIADVNSYLGEVNAKMSETSRSHEYEADSMAVEFLANTGINPKGYIDVIATLHSSSYKPIAAVGDSHTGEVERIKNIQDSMEAKTAACRRAQSQIVKPVACHIVMMNACKLLLFIQGAPGLTRAWPLNRSRRIVCLGNDGLGGSPSK